MPEPVGEGVFVVCLGASFADANEGSELSVSCGMNVMRMKKVMLDGGFGGGPESRRWFNVSQKWVERGQEDETKGMMKKESQR